MNGERKEGKLLEKYLVEKIRFTEELKLKMKEGNLFKQNLNEFCDEEGPLRLDNNGFHVFIVYSSADVHSIAPGC